jgi:hypothetical protein
MKLRFWVITWGLLVDVRAFAHAVMLCAEKKMLEASR